MVLVIPFYNFDFYIYKTLIFYLLMFVLIIWFMKSPSGLFCTTDI